ncbi:PH domain-containing protein [Sinimarinibacterium sp. NLF-5-8]|uniref:PH domain-containing protein n=1 Tax=Sinimarinibacterium sp. NLF-5-8 TaxID=2698684 RepID=UPI00137BB059|nr:PH domain-containing protein [Sinimarinibacterium sp. NLF-5-8]QHS09094.1 PH domain-containing protein [Sinimarinibacterium sp. NLF-5-8]
MSNPTDFSIDGGGTAPLNSDSEEVTLWQGSPSPWMHGPSWGFSLLSCLLVVGVFWCGWLYLVARCTRYTVTSKRIIVESGVLNKKRNQIELYRIRDVSAVQMWWMRPLGLGSAEIFSTDITTPQLRLAAIPNHIAVMSKIRNAVERIRMDYGIRAVDFQSV